METEINDAREQLWHLWFSMPSWWEQRNSSASHFRGDNLPKSIFGAMMNLIILVKWLLFGIFESRRPVCNTSSKLFKFFFSFKKSPKMDFGGVMVTSLLGNLKCHFFSSFQKWHNYVATWPNPVNQPNVLLSIKWVYDSQTTKYWQNFCPICMISFSWPLKKTI